ncbi:hypothetical protein NDU88_000293 [Pleurodeles waltl]|uniref:Uncharacterized protein n=1 Tax=Pleurodeles waltl TaxID=8319 RepID=A0AAV7TEP7_PLEWA|nr:hypothetical protein NDU88_000293 [Pleurodeles waltl]
MALSKRPTWCPFQGAHALSWTGCRPEQGLQKKSMCSDNYFSRSDDDIPDVQEELDPMDQMASLIPTELAGGVERQNSAELEDQQELQNGQTIPPEDQSVRDAQSVYDTTLPAHG